MRPESNQLEIDMKEPKINWNYRHVLSYLNVLLPFDNKKNKRSERIYCSYHKTITDVDIPALDTVIDELSKKLKSWFKLDMPVYNCYNTLMQIYTCTHYSFPVILFIYLTVVYFAGVN